MASNKDQQPLKVVAPSSRPWPRARSRVVRRSSPAVASSGCTYRRNDIDLQRTRPRMPKPAERRRTIPNEPGPRPSPASPAYAIPEGCIDKQGTPVPFDLMHRSDDVSSALGAQRRCSAGDRAALDELARAAAADEAARRGSRRRRGPRRLGRRRGPRGPRTACSRSCGGGRRRAASDAAVGSKTTMSASRPTSSAPLRARPNRAAGVVDEQVDHPLERSAARGRRPRCTRAPAASRCRARRC